MRRWLVAFLFGTMTAISVCAQTPVTACTSGSFSTYVAMGSGSCSIGDVTFSNFAYGFTEDVGWDSTPTIVTTPPANYGLTPISSPGQVGFDVNSPLVAPAQSECGLSGYPGQAQCLAESTVQASFSLTFDFTTTNGATVDGVGLNSQLEGGNDGIVVDAPGVATVWASCYYSPVGGPNCSSAAPLACGGCVPGLQNVPGTPTSSGSVSVSADAEDGGEVPESDVMLDVAIVPEPATWLLFGTGMALLALASLRRRKPGSCLGL